MLSTGSFFPQKELNFPHPPDDPLMQLLFAGFAVKSLRVNERRQQLDKLRMFDRYELSPSVVTIVNKEINGTVCR